MKKTKILVPAMAVLALGMAAAVTGTVAWFSSNTRVTASGMTISAATSKSLMISDVSGSGWTNAITLDSTVAQKSAVLPVTPVDLKTDTPVAIHGKSSPYTMTSNTLNFYGINLQANNVEDPSAYNAEHSIDDALTEGKFGDAAGAGENANWFVKNTGSDYVHDDAYLLYSAPDVEGQPGTTAVNLRVEVSVPDTGVNIWKALHIGVLKASAGGARAAGSVAAGDIFYNWDMSAVVTEQNPFSSNKATITENSIVTLTSGTEWHFELFAWFEGEDADCTTLNSMASVTDGINFFFELPA